MRFCDECGAKLEDNAQFCDECGAKVETVVATTGVMEEAVQSENKRVSGNSTNGGGNKGTKVVIIILCLLLCGAMAVIFILWKGKDNTGSSETEKIGTETKIPQSKEPEVVAGEASKLPDEESDTKETKIPESDADIKETEVPVTKAPATKTPATKAPATKTPVTKIPEKTKAPATKTPATKAPATKAPATKAPVTKAPATKAPATKAPATKNPSAKKVYALVSKTTYDEYDNLLEKSKYSYDVNGKLVSEKLTRPGPGESTGTYESKYDKYGNVIETTWYGIHDDYIFKIYYEYEYDKNHNKIKENYYYVDEEDYYGCEMDGYFEYTYDANNNLIEEYMITNGRYLGTNAYDYFYDENNRIIVKSCYAGDSRDEYYDLAYEDFYEYDKKGRVICVEERINGDVYTRKNYSYDDKGNVIKETIYYAITQEQTIIKYKYDWVN